MDFWRELSRKAARNEVAMSDDFSVEQWPDEFLIVDNSDDWTIYTTTDTEYTLQFQAIALNDAAVAITARDAAIAAQQQADDDVAAIAAMIATMAGGTTNQLLIKNSNADYDFGWANPVGMLTAIYDPTGIAANAFARANHTGTQLSATISDFNASADARIAAAVGVSVQAYSAILAGTTASYTVALNTKLGGIATGADVTVSALPVAIHGAAAKATPVDADELGIADSAAAFGLKKLTWANVKTAINGFLNGTNKGSFADADAFYIGDSAAGFIAKWANGTALKAYLKTYFDTIYLLATSYTAADVLTKIKTVDGTGSGLDADLIDGFNSSAATAINTVPVRDAAGDIATRLFRNEYTGGGWTGGFMVGMNANGGVGADNYMRPVPVATVQTTLGIGTMANRSVTISAAAPSGGVDGDVWFQI